jgi:predicted HTH domain antitoxin
MTVSFQLPAELERSLRQDLGNVDAEAKEAFLVALYRRGVVSHLALSQALGLDRMETEDVLHKHNVTEDLGSVDDYLKDARALEQLRDDGR